MSWVRLDDNFPDHPKVLAAGPLAKALYVDALCYCNRMLTNGWIPALMAGRLAREYAAYSGDDLVRQLVDANLWDACDDGYRIHDYLDYQRSAERVKDDQGGNARRQAEWRARQRNDSVTPLRNVTRNATRNATVTEDRNADASKITPESGNVADSQHKSGALRNATITPLTSQPINTDSSDEESIHTLKSTKKNLAGFAEFYATYPRKVARATAESAWSKLTKPDRDAARAAIQKQLAWPAFANAPPDKVPYPATWLNGRRWEDEAPRAASRTANGPAGMSRDELIAIGNGAAPHDHPGNRENAGDPVDRLVQ